MVRFDLRISEELNNWLIEQARRNHRSKNKQIEYILEQAKVIHILDNTPQETYFTDKAVKATWF